MPTTARQRVVTGVLIAACGSFLFASKGLFSKALLVRGVDYITLTALRAVLSLPMFIALALWRGLSLRSAPPAALARAALAGVLCYGYGALIDFRALELIDVSLERALMFSYPALIVFWYAFVRRQSPSRATVVALCLTYFGIVLVVGAFDAGLWRQNLTGALMVMSAAATTAAYFLLGERCIPDLGSSGFTIVAMGAAAVVVCVTYLFSHPLVAIAALGAHEWLLLLALAVLCMFLPTLCQAEAIKRIGAQRSSLASTISPPAALLLGTVFLHEQPGIWQLAGTVAILAGIVFLSTRSE
jgi:drug/metabolite transporter (DMT)-like permease